MEAGYIALMVTIALSLVINMLMHEILSSAERVRLLVGTAKFRERSTIPVIVIFLTFCYLLLMRKDGGDFPIGGFGLIVACLLIRTALNFWTMDALSMPPGYRILFSIDQITTLIGLVWFFFGILSSDWRTGTPLNDAQTTIKAQKARHETAGKEVTATFDKFMSPPDRKDLWQEHHCGRFKIQLNYTL